MSKKEKRRILNDWKAPLKVPEFEELERMTDENGLLPGQFDTNKHWSVKRIMPGHRNPPPPPPKRDVHFEHISNPNNWHGPIAPKVEMPKRDKTGNVPCMKVIAVILIVLFWSAVAAIAFALICISLNL